LFKGKKTAVKLVVVSGIEARDKNLARIVEHVTVLELVDHYVAECRIGKKSQLFAKPSPSIQKRHDNRKS